MESKDFFKKTFVFVFIFIFVSKFIFQIFDGINTITVNFVLKILTNAFVTALIIGGLNYYVKIGFNIQKENNKSKE